MTTREEQISYDQESKTKKYFLLGFKVIELCLIIICIGLLDDPAHNSRISTFVSQRSISLSYTTYGAFIIYIAVYLLMSIIKDIDSWKKTALMSLIGFILFLACGSMLLKDWGIAKERNYWHPNVHRLDFVCGTGSTAIVTSLVFLIDLLMTVRLGIRGELD